MLTKAGYTQMKLNWLAPLLTVLFFFAVGFLILYDQYTRTGVWFEFSQIHHETLAMVSFALAIGILIGSVLKK
jgi:hypothetical protein